MPTTTPALNCATTTLSTVAFTPSGAYRQPGDVASVITFLLSGKAAWTTGTVYDMDGTCSADDGYWLITG